MDMKVSETAAVSAVPAPDRTVVPILAAISVSHLLNDMIQSLIPAIYPILKSTFRLDFAQIGLITLTFQLTASLLQPLVGLYTDRARSPISLAVGMGFTLDRIAPALGRAQLPALLLVGRRSWAWARRCSTRNPRGSPAWPRADGTGSRSRSSRSAAMRGRRSGRCSPRSSSFRAARAASPGSRWPPSSAMVVLFDVGRWYRGTQVARRQGQVGAAESATGLSPRRVAIGDRDPDRARLLEVLLPGQPEQLLTPST